MDKQELLAPAGDIESGYAALYYGADALYLGLAKFSARATAVNFDENSLDELTAYAHSLNRKIYVAINTIVQEAELNELMDSLDICARCRVDGLIIQDLGVARIIREKYPFFEMHASTQMAVHNKEGALFLQKIGFKRVVLARELTLAEIKEIAAIPNLETEVFIHGALCYSYSGLCQFSAMEYNRSANRGKCLYPCRANFELNGHKGHLFSMKDMALEEDVLKLPVDSLKIEGRKKSALYVAAVTDYYRRILDEKTQNQAKAENIKQIFSRPWCKFHFNGKNKSVIDTEFVGHRGLLIGKVQKISHGWLTFKTTHKIARYDGLQIDVAGCEKPFGFSVQKISVNNKNVVETSADEFVMVELPPTYPQIKAHDKIYLASSSAVKGFYRYEKPKQHAFYATNNIDVEVTIKSDKLEAVCGEYKSELKGIFLPADNVKKMQEAVYNAFNKTGNTSFKLNKFTVLNKDALFVPVSLLNKLRRDLYTKIQPKVIKNDLPEITLRKKSQSVPQFKIKIDNLAYLQHLNINDFVQIIYLIGPDSDIKELSRLPKNKIRIALPSLCRQPTQYAELITKLLESGYNKWEVGNYWALNMLPLAKLDINFDSSLYMLNTQAIEQAKKIGASGITLSLEDTSVNIAELIKRSSLPIDLVIYQDIPLFSSACCIRDNDCKSCTHQDLWFDIKKDGKKYKALSHNCEMMIFDDKPFCIASKVKDMHPDYFRIDFCYCKYSPDEVFNIVNKLIKFNDLSNCINGNFDNFNI